MRMRFRFVVRALVVLAMAAAPSTAFGATVTWDRGAGTDNWSDPVNWSTNSLPTSSDNVVIAFVGMGIVHVDMNPTVNSITVQNGATLWILTGQVLTVNNSSTVNFGGSLALEENSNFSGSGDLTIDGILHIFGGTVGGSGALTITSNGYLRAWVAVNSSVISRTTTNDGNLDYLDAGSPGSNFTFNGSSITNNGSIGILTDHDIDSNLASHVLSNHGTLKKITGSGSAGINFSSQQRQRGHDRGGLRHARAQPRRERPRRVRDRIRRDPRSLRR